MSTSLETSAGVKAVKWEPVSRASSSNQLLSPGSIVARLIGYAEEYWSGDRSGERRRNAKSEGEALKGLLDVVQHTTGINAHSLNQAMVMHRIGWRMRLNGIDDLASYRELLEVSTTELPALRKSLFIRVTDFFKDPLTFMELEGSIIPALFKTCGREGLRILVHGCGTGEEAYTLAFLLAAYMKKTRKQPAIRILANDSDKNALIRARRGFYPHLITADLSPLCLDQFFEATKEGYCVNERVRKMVRFMPGHHNDPSAFSDLNMLICRNALIFGGNNDEDQLLATFFNRLRPEGYLVIDPAIESRFISKYFDEIDAGHGIYRRKKSVGRAIEPGEETLLTERTRNEDRKIYTRYVEDALYHTRERLAMAVSEYETTHDDLVDLNHELQSSIREARLEKDQIEAEHGTLVEMKDSILKANKEFKKQNDRVRQSIMRLEHLVMQSGVAVLYLNKELCIELFTPAVAALFGLQRSDIGRPMSSMNSPFRWKIEKDATQVLRTQASIEKEAIESNGQWFRVILSPFIVEGKDEGVVCTFIDITEQRRAIEWERYKAAVLEQMSDMVVVTNRELRVTYMNRAAIERYGLYGKKSSGMLLCDLYRNAWKNVDEKEAAHLALSEKGFWAGDHVQVMQEGRKIRVNSAIHLLIDDDGQELGLLTVAREIQPREENDEASMHSLISDLERRSAALIHKVDRRVNAETV